MQWHAMAVVLSELTEQPHTPDTDRAWQVIEETGPDWEIPEDRPSRILYQSVKKLLSKARARRASESDATNSAQQSLTPDDHKVTVTSDSVYPAQTSLFEPPLLGHTQQNHPFHPHPLSHQQHQQQHLLPQPQQHPQPHQQPHPHSHSQQPPHTQPHVQPHPQLHPHPTNFLPTPQHTIQQFYVPQHLTHPETNDLQTQQPVVPWYFDPNAQALPEQELLFNTEYWSGWDPVKDYSLHGGTT
jgi:hypothetical protein